MITQDITFNSKDQLVLGDGVQTDSVKPTASTAYKRGDLLVVGAGNVATHSADANDWHVIALADVTESQVDEALAKGFDIPVYTQGEFNVDAVMLNGQPLDTEKKATARGRANTATAIELRTPFVAK